MENTIQELKNSYYDYVIKIANGCQYIANQLRLGKATGALEGIVDLSEGLEALLKIEGFLTEQHWTVKSRLEEANAYLVEINSALIDGDYVTVADIFEYEIQPIFDSASEWVFTFEGGM